MSAVSETAGDAGGEAARNLGDAARELRETLRCAPVATEGKLVAFSPYRAFGFVGGKLAWLGKERIGRIDVEEDGKAHWYVSLPSETMAIDGVEDNQEDAKERVETWARVWCRNAGLIPTAHMGLGTEIDAVMKAFYGTRGRLGVDEPDAASLDALFDPGG